jgi:hypothetical protein
MNNAFRSRNGNVLPAAARSDRPGERAHDGSGDGYLRRRELAHRCNDGLDVALFWHPATDELTVRGYDRRSGARFEFHPEPTQRWTRSTTPTCTSPATTCTVTMTGSPPNPRDAPRAPTLTHVRQ